MKISFLADYIEHIRKSKSSDDKAFLVLVTPGDDAATGATEWEGSVNMIRNAIGKTEERLNEDYNVKITQVKDLILENKARQNAFNKDTNK